jgi:hypothetical protein
MFRTTSVQQGSAGAAPLTLEDSGFDVISVMWEGGFGMEVDALDLEPNNQRAC